MKLTKKMKVLSDRNKSLSFFTYKGVNYQITGTDLKHNSCQIKNLDTGEYKRMETTDGSLGDVKKFNIDEVNKFRNNG